MKIETTIKPRKDGKVNAEIDGTTYVFAADESGALVCDVEDEGNIGILLANENFIPADEADFARAEEIASRSDQDGDGGPDEDHDEQDMNAAPIEEPASAVAGVPKAKGGRPRKVK